MTEDVGKVFGSFEGEACGFTGSGWLIQIAWVGFVRGGLVKVELVGRGGGGREMSEVSEEEYRELSGVMGKLFYL